MKKIKIVLPPQISPTDIAKTKNIWEYMGVPKPVGPCECEKCVKQRFDEYIDEVAGEVDRELRCAAFHKQFEDVVKQELMDICATDCVCVKCVANSYKK